MRSLSLIFYQLTLLRHLIHFSWQVFKLKLGRNRFFIIFITIFVSLGILLSLFALPHSTKTPEKRLVVSTPDKSELYVQKMLTEEEINLELEYWLNIQESQPTHRDVLINISQLYRSLGKEGQAIYYWEQARKADPNHELFK